MNAGQLFELIRTIPDYPKPGILFYDITSVLQDAAGFRACIDHMLSQCEGLTIDKVVGTEARGFIFAPAVAYELGAGFVPVRKPNKLPSQRISFEYALEYGSDCLEIHQDAIRPGERVLVVDDLLATGGTAYAVTQLVEKLGGEVVGLNFLLELEGLGGRSVLSQYVCQSVMKTLG